MKTLTPKAGYESLAEPFSSLQYPIILCILQPTLSHLTTQSFFALCNRNSHTPLLNLPTENLSPAFLNTGLILFTQWHTEEGDEEVIQEEGVLPHVRSFKSLTVISYSNCYLHLVQNRETVGSFGTGK